MLIYYYAIINGAKKEGQLLRLGQFFTSPCNICKLQIQSLYSNLIIFNLNVFGILKFQSYSKTIDTSRAITLEVVAGLNFCFYMSTTMNLRIRGNFVHTNGCHSSDQALIHLMPLYWRLWPINNYPLLWWVFVLFFFCLAWHFCNGIHVICFVSESCLGLWPCLLFVLLVKWGFVVLHNLCGFLFVNDCFYEKKDMYRQLFMQIINIFKYYSKCKYPICSYIFLSMIEFQLRTLRIQETQYITIH